MTTEEKEECRWCHGLGYDASGLHCTCQPDPFPWWPWIEAWFAKIFRRKG